MTEAAHEAPATDSLEDRATLSMGRFLPGLVCDFDSISAHQARNRWPGLADEEGPLHGHVRCVSATGQEVTGEISHMCMPAYKLTPSAAGALHKGRQYSLRNNRLIYIAACRWRIVPCAWRK